MLDAYDDSSKARSAQETLEGNGWHYRHGKWVPPDEAAEQDRIVEARAKWLGLVLHPVVVSYDIDKGGCKYETRTVRASWVDKQGGAQACSASDKIHPTSLRDSLAPDKLRHNIDNALRNRVTGVALREYYTED